jgi:hypothetical protein
MVKLEMIGSVMCNKDEERMMLWEQIIRTGLKRRIPNHNFTCILRKVMFGCLIMFFARDDSIQSIHKMHTCKVKTGAGGMAANKGATSIRFNYDDSSFMFLNCHLASG